MFIWTFTKTPPTAKPRTSDRLGTVVTERADPPSRAQASHS
jgi:hypothetical protein